MASAHVELTLSFAAAHRVESSLAGCPGMHGHNFRLRILVAGEIDPVTGTVLDMPHAQDLLRTVVYEPLDHRLLNDRIENPTLERVAQHIYLELSARLPGLTELSLDDGAGRAAVIRR
jgi:6-pyruvoyltetrahydropterin/6-carboxytetrahydropterin synthase